MTNIVNRVYICTINLIAMKAIQFIPETPGSLLKKVFQNVGLFELRIPFTEQLSKQALFFKSLSAQTKGYNLNIKNTVSYLFNAFLEGVKQNFFGPDTEMEFFMLTIRVYAILAVKLAFSHLPFISLKSF